MGRNALIVGISTYSYGGLKNLDAPSKDAEAIAQRLESGPSPFQVERLPGIKDVNNDALKTGKKSQVTLRQLKEKLVQYFNPRGDTYADTVLFYYSGHGLFDPVEGQSYLATSDVNPDGEKWGYSLRNLSELLRHSPVKRQIVWLDCCHSGSLIAIKAANPGEQAGYSRCFIAASQEIESAYELASGSHGVLTDGLLQGLNPERLSGQWIDTLSLCSFVNQYLKNVRRTYPQRTLFLNLGEPINLTRTEGSNIASEDWKELKVDRCPYKALESFEADDSDLFFGRTTLIDELLEQVCEHHFLAVLGPSGSGKSSVVKAGLLPELTRGKRRSSTEDWTILPPITPGESPLERLSCIFIPNALLSKKKGQILLQSYVEDLKEHGFKAVVDLITAEESEHPIVLVVDQFEEIFTLCQGNEEKEEERKQFLECLFGAVDALGGKLRLVVTMRADFLSKCLEQTSGRLAERIASCQVNVRPLSDVELEDVICKPAEQVGLKIDPELKVQIKHEVQAAPGRLPLLEYALTELWKTWYEDYQANNQIQPELTSEHYIRIGGVAGALEKQANAVYEQFRNDSIRQDLVERIFLELVQPGVDTEDTRKRVRKRNLLSNIHSESLVDEVLESLAKSRLIVKDVVEVKVFQSGEQGWDVEVASKETVIDLAHESLIRHWNKLREWLEEHRANLPLIRQLRERAQDWQKDKVLPKQYFLQGVDLAKALDCLEQYRHSGYFDATTQKFIELSEAARIADETEKETQILESLYMTAEVQWNKRQQLESLISITKAAKHYKWLLQNKPKIKPANGKNVVAKLQETLYERIQESNRLERHNVNLNGFGGGISRLLYSPDGSTLASASWDGTVKLWNAKDSSLVHSLEGHRTGVISMAYSPDGRTIASGDFNNTANIWDAADGRLIHCLESLTEGQERDQERVISLAYSSDSQTIVSANFDNVVRLWNVIDGSLIHNLKGHSSTVVRVTYSPDGKTIASAGEDGTIKLWHAIDGHLVFNLEGHKDTISLVVYSPNGRTLASAGPLGKRADFLASGVNDTKVILWNAVDGSFISNLEGHTDHVNALVYSPDGKTLASASDDKTIKLWSAVNGSLIRSLEGHNSRVSLIVYSPNGETLASGSDDDTIKLWDAAEGSLICSLEGHAERITALTYSPDGKTLASGSEDNIIKLWNLTHFKFKSSWVARIRRAISITYSPDGKTFASVCNDKIISIWNAVEGNLLYALEGHNNHVDIAIYSPDGKTLASADRDQIIKLWSTISGRLLHTLKGHSKKIDSVAYNPNGNVIASASWDGTIRLWNIADGSLRAVLCHSSIVTALAYSPDGKTIASTAADENLIKIWNTVDGSLIYNINDDNVIALAYSPDGCTLASSSYGRIVKLWNVVDGSLIHSLEGHRSSVRNIVFSPDGETLASASDDRTIRTWNTRDGSLVHTMEDDNLMIKALVFSPNGKTLASTGYETIKLWNTVEGSLICSLKYPFADIAFSSDGTKLFTSCASGGVRLWDVDFDLNLDAMIILACEWLRDYLMHSPNVSERDRKLLEDV